MQKFYLLRHGQTEWNVAGKIQGRLDSPLTELGKDRAKQWGLYLQKIGINRIISSPQKRAFETAQIINAELGTSISTENNLREQDWGDWEGVNRREINNNPELQKRIKLGWDFFAPNGESRLEVLARAKEVLLNTTSDCNLIICHQGVLKALIYHLAERKFLPDEKKLINKDDLHCIVKVGDKLSIHELNIPLP